MRSQLSDWKEKKTCPKREKREENQWKWKEKKIRRNERGMGKEKK